MSGKIIAFEGVDGVGKTTHLLATSNFLATLDIPHIATQELSGNDLRHDLRMMLMHDLDGMEELLLITLARRWHYRNIIQPAIAQGKVVLLDRFVESTWAYQGGGRQIDARLIKLCEEEFWKVPEPDLTIYLYGKSQRRRKQDRFEKAGHSFFSRVRSMYESRRKEKWVILEAGRGFDETQDAINQRIAALVKPVVHNSEIK